MSDRIAERVYRLLLRLYPSRFRDEYGAEALALFRDRLRAERGFRERAQLWIDLICDTALSLPAEYRRQPIRPEGSHAAKGLMFYQCGPELPRRSALVNGAILTIAVFSGITLFMGSAATHAPWVIGSHHPSPSHILPASATAVPTSELDAEVKLKPMPYVPPQPAYFKIMPVLLALDTDQDGVISAAEIANAPELLRKLDKNHDGILTAEECNMPLTRGSSKRVLAKDDQIAFMKFHPVLAALDSDHDGEISAREIKNAAAALRTLDRNHDGKLDLKELLPLAPINRR
jgi:Ca2+-binding EF-hand superfamily protein